MKNGITDLMETTIYYKNFQILVYPTECIIVGLPLMPFLNVEAAKRHIDKCTSIK